MSCRSQPKRRDALASVFAELLQPLVANQRQLALHRADGKAQVLADFGGGVSFQCFFGDLHQGFAVQALHSALILVVQEHHVFGRRLFPKLKVFGRADDETESELYRVIGLEAVVDRSSPPGLDLAAAVLQSLDIDPDAVTAWSAAERKRASGITDAVAIAA